MALLAAMLKQMGQGSNNGAPAKPLGGATENP
jgi:hypothetical protein